MAAAEQLIDYDLDILIIDEQASPGGQIYRQPPHAFKVDNWLSSRIYKNGKSLLKKVSENKKINWLTQTTVLGITQSDDNETNYPHKITTCNRKGIQDIQTKSLLITPGCHDMSIVFPGCHLPGVMATGGIQTLVKSQQLIPGERFLFAGTHPLQLIVADQIVQAGGEVVGMIFAQRFSQVFAILRSPSVLIRHAGKFLYLAGVLLRLIKAGIPIRFSETLIQANGKARLASVSIGAIDRSGDIKKDTVREILCDRLGICFGFLASSELARQYGADYSWSSAGGGWVIKHDEWMSTGVAGVYVAGEITGVAGAEVAAAEGRLAGLGIAQYLGRPGSQAALPLFKKTHRRLQHLNQFANILKYLSYPGGKLLSQLATEESILCKCEKITLGEFKQKLVEHHHISNAGAAKLFSRTGMGLCQGRYCHYYMTKILSEHGALSEQDIGPFTARFPVKPVTIKSLIK